jgi:hypothetical protein
MHSRLIVGTLALASILLWSALSASEGALAPRLKEPPQDHPATNQIPRGPFRLDETKSAGHALLQIQLEALDLQKRQLEEQAREQIRQLNEQVQEQIEQWKSDLARQTEQLQKQAKRQNEQTQSSLKRQVQMLELQQKLLEANARATTWQSGIDTPAGPGLRSGFRTTDEKLDKILERLERLEQRLDRMEKR